LPGNWRTWRDMAAETSSRGAAPGGRYGGTGSGRWRVGIDQLGTDARAALEPGHGIRSSVIITVDRPEDVDALVRHAREAGATVTKEPTDAEFFEGRDAYFADPEGNYWEVAWAARDNPVTAAARRAAGLATDVQP
jgi:catechol 2,3-dioxygenase-like lactoylglutathione lyase family enzyme